MKITLLNTDDVLGGAGIAAYRIMNSLTSDDIQAEMLVLQKYSDDDKVHQLITTGYKKVGWLMRLAFEKGKLQFLQRDNSVRFSFSMANTGYHLSSHRLVKRADIIHLHWINNAMLSLSGIQQLLQLNKPVLWTLHDMWPFTGGCHISYECDNFQSGCGNCFYLKNPKSNDSSRKIHATKERIFQGADIKIVTVSNWLKKQAESSSLFKNKVIKVIPNAVDTEIFKPSGKIKNRINYNIDPAKKILLFVSSKIDHPIKGFEYFVEAMHQLYSTDENKELFECVVVGNFSRHQSINSYNIPFKTHHFDKVTKSEDLVNFYSLSDITLVTSKYESFSQVCAESMACATPVIAFSHSGPTDIIDHKVNGYLSEKDLVSDIVAGINWIIHNNLKGTVSRDARNKIVKNFHPSIVGAQYEELYRTIHEEE